MAALVLAPEELMAELVTNEELDDLELAAEPVTVEEPEDFELAAEEEAVALKPAAELVTNAELEDLELPTEEELVALELAPEDELAFAEVGAGSTTSVMTSVTVTKTVEAWTVRTLLLGTVVRAVEVIVLLMVLMAELPVLAPDSKTSTTVVRKTISVSTASTITVVSVGVRVDRNTVVLSFGESASGCLAEDWTAGEPPALLVTRAVGAAPDGFRGAP